MNSNHIFCYFSWNFQKKKMMERSAKLFQDCAETYDGGKRGDSGLMNDPMAMDAVLPDTSEVMMLFEDTHCKLRFSGRD